MIDIFIVYGGRVIPSVFVIFTLVYLIIALIMRVIKSPTKLYYSRNLLITWGMCFLIRLLIFPDWNKNISLVILIPFFSSIIITISQLIINNKTSEKNNNNDTGVE